MRNPRLVKILLAGVLLLVLGGSACGKKTDPVPPERKTATTAAVAVAVS